MASVRVSESGEKIIQEILETNNTTRTLTPEMVDMIQGDLEKKRLSQESLRHLSVFLKTEGQGRTLKSLLLGSSLVFEKFIRAPKQEDTIEKQKRRDYLEKKQQTREYNMMIHGSHRVETPQDSVAESLKSAKFSMAVSTNMIVTLFATFGIGYYAASKLRYTKNQSLVAGLLAAIAMYLVEMALYIIRSTKLERVPKPKNIDMQINVQHS